MRLRLLLLPLILSARVASAQGSVPAATVTGTVHDSIAGRPLAAAVVQIVPASHLASSGYSAMTDSLGRFVFADVPAGAYVIGFFHGRLDALGLEPPVRRLQVAGTQAVEVLLATPSAATVRAALCGTGASGSLATGTTRDAQGGAPREGARVAGEWIEISFGTRGITLARQRREVASGAGGRYLVCDVPRAGFVTLVAAQGGDSTGTIEVTVPPEGIAVRDLYLGSGAEGRISGTVTEAGGDRRIAGAIVEMVGGPRTRASARGEWSLSALPVGTHTIDVRAVGYVPERVAVDIIGSPAPVDVALITTRALLDTVRVTAARSDADLMAFEERRRRGMGRYFTPEDVARWRPIQTSGLFHQVPGLRVDRTPLGDEVVTMRALVGDRCVPAVYVDGHFMRDLTADDIDSWVRPEEVAGMEIYSATNLPGEFSMGMRDGCGAIVIWTRVAPGPVSRESWLRRMAKAGIVVAIAALLSVLFD